MAHPVLDQQHEVIEDAVDKNQVENLQVYAPSLELLATRNCFFARHAKPYVPTSGKSSSPYMMGQISLSLFCALSHSPKEVTPPLPIVV